MVDSTRQVSASLEALSEAYCQIAENLSNASTPGFKRHLVTLMSTGGPQDQSGDIQAEQRCDYTQGALRQTGRALDLAVSGDGFFVIETPQGPLYTRYGTFQLNAQRQLVDSLGRTVSGQAGPITLPPDVSPDQIQISRQGAVCVAGTTVGRLRVVSFDDPQKLIRAGAVHFRAPAGLEPTDVASPMIHQGFRESSNVNVARELVDLITVSRLYQANIKSIQAQDDRLKYLMQAAMA